MCRAVNLRYAVFSSAQLFFSSITGPEICPERGCFFICLFVICDASCFIPERFQEACASSAGKQTNKSRTEIRSRGDLFSVRSRCACCRAPSKCLLCSFHFFQAWTTTNLYIILKAAYRRWTTAASTGAKLPYLLCFVLFFLISFLSLCSVILNSFSVTWPWDSKTTFRRYHNNKKQKFNRFFDLFVKQN